METFRFTLNLKSLARVYQQVNLYLFLIQHGDMAECAGVEVTFHVLLSNIAVEGAPILFRFVKLGKFHPFFYRLGKSLG